MPKFKVKEGTHIEGGVTYTKGQVLDSPLNLVALFKEKFEKVGESDPVKPAASTPAETSPATSEPAAPPAKPKKKKSKAESKEEWGDND